MMGRWLVWTTVLAIAWQCDAPRSFGDRHLEIATKAAAMPAHGRKKSLKGYDITETGLRPRFPSDYVCSPLTSLYASWIDVDGTRRDEPHSGVDGGHLNDPVLAPAPGTVRRVWVADWGQGREGALLILHTREDLNLSGEPKFYYSEFDHLRYSDIENLKEGQRIKRGEQIAKVARPGGKKIYLPEVHLEVYEVEDDAAIVWRIGEHGTEYFENPTSRLIDPLYLLSRETRPNDQLEVMVVPFETGHDYSAFKGFTYWLPCHRSPR
jgi:murein DD-endopeptidase MepM/ murein hydrolase activator NlpD